MRRVLRAATAVLAFALIVGAIHLSLLGTWNGNSSGYVCNGSPIGTFLHPNPVPAVAENADFDDDAGCNSDARHWVELASGLDGVAVAVGGSVLSVSRRRRADHKFATEVAALGDAAQRVGPAASADTHSVKDRRRRSPL